MPEDVSPLGMDQDPAILIEAALKSYPVVPTPEGFSNRVMVQVRKLQTERRHADRPAPRFHLDFLDFALPVFFALFGMLILALPLAALALADPVWLLQAQLELRMVFGQIQSTSYSLQAALAILAVLIATGCAAVLLVAYTWLAPIADVKFPLRRI